MAFSLKGKALYEACYNTSWMASRHFVGIIYPSKFSLWHLKAKSEKSNVLSI